MRVAKDSIGETEELNTPPPSNVSSQENNQITIYSGNRTEAAGLDADYSSTAENFLAVGSLIEIFPADILQAQEVFSAEDVTTGQLATDISDNVPNMEEVTNILIKEKSEIQPNNQEAKMPLKSLVNIGRGRGRARANFRPNPTLPNNSSVGRGQIRSMMKQPVNNQVRAYSSEKMIKIMTSSTRCPSNAAGPSSSNAMQASQQMDCRMRNIKTETQGEGEQYRQKSYASAGAYPNQRANCSTNSPRVNEEHPNANAPRRPASMSSIPPGTRMYSTPSQQYVPCGDQNRETRNRSYQSNNVEQHAFRSHPVMHHEGSSFMAITICHNCGNKKEHILNEPGTWPVRQCLNCRNNWVITDWRKYESDDDDIVYICEVVNNFKPKKRRPPPAYDANGIKIEPDDLANIPTCMQCGGHHIPAHGQQWNPGFCPNSGYTNWNV